MSGMLPTGFRINVVHVHPAHGDRRGPMARSCQLHADDSDSDASCGASPAQVPALVQGVAQARLQRPPTAGRVRLPSPVVQQQPAAAALAGALGQLQLQPPQPPQPQQDLAVRNLAAAFEGAAKD